ncbi:IS110 family transposase [Candidatus Woesearchaeota archaeon]|nr:IS110 family transposase [Candidatus Woesearchaeota archaeon]
MQNTIERTLISSSKNYLYLGIDTHKDQHAVVGLNCFSEVLYEKEINNSEEDFNQLIKEVKKTGFEPIFGLEDCYSYGARLANYLFQNGFSVRIVSPVLVERERKYNTHPEKSDLIDAKGVAKALIHRIGTLPHYSVSKEEETAKEIKDLVMDREFLVKEQTRIKNQLHRLLHKAYNSGYRTKFKNPFSEKAKKYWLRSCLKLSSPISKNQIRRKVKRLTDIKKEILEIEEELMVLVGQTDQKLETMNGCGLVLAASVIAEVKNIDRFKSNDTLAKYGGFCPRERSSGKKVRHIKTNSGNRRLNKAIHRIALSQIGRNGNIYAKEYFMKKVSEGKSKPQALCCLKRRLVKIIFQMMKYRQEYRYIRNIFT